MRSNITTYRLYLVSEALRNMDLQLLLEPIVKKLLRKDAVPYGIQRVGDYVEIGFKNPTADIKRNLEKMFFNQKGLNIYLLKKEDSLILINIAGCEFQEEAETIQEYLGNAGKMVNYYRQTKKYAGHEIETGVVTFWFRTLDYDLEKKIDKRRRMFFNNEKYEEMRGRKKENEAESEPKDNSKATLVESPPVKRASKVASFDAAWAVGKHAAKLSWYDEPPAITASQDVAMYVDDPEMIQRKAAESEARRREIERERVKYERERRMKEKIDKAKETLKKKPKAYEGAYST